jgi:uncharacterized protein (DUF58 family)
MSRAGAVASLGIALCLLAELFGVHAFLVPAVALVLVALGAALAVRVMCWRVRLTREPLSASAEEGVRLRVHTRLEGPRALRRSGEFAALLGGEPRPRRWLEGQSFEVSALARRRGVHEIAPSALRFGDPFGLCERSVLSEPTRMLVLPRVEAVRRAELARLGALSNSRRALAAAAGGELDDLRRADSYASARHIHWLSTARTGTLMERRLRPESQARPLVVLDGRDAAGADAFDAAVRAVASLALALARAGGCSLLLPPERRAHRLDGALGSWPRIHAQLAMIAPSEALAWEVIRAAPLILWVSASADAHALRHEGDGAGFIASPFPAAHGEVLFTVAGCAVQRLRQRAVVGAT